MATSCKPIVAAVDTIPSTTTVPSNTVSPYPTITNTIIPTATAIPTKTSIPTSTVTPISLYDIKLQVFHDYNGNGALEEGEPLLSGIVVSSMGNECVTEANGTCILIGFPVGEYQINISDPRRIFRFILLSNEVVLMMDSALDFLVTDSEENSILIPLGVGFHTLPFSCDEDSEPLGYYDHDKREGFSRNYLGEHTSIWNYPLRIRGTDDGHTGLDYLLDMRVPIYASAPGRVIEAKDVQVTGRTPQKFIVIDHGYGIYPRLSSYHHLSEINVERWDEVVRGQQIGLSGISGSTWPHLHFAIITGERFERTDYGYPIDVYRDELDERALGYWTVDNLPQCLP